MKITAVMGAIAGNDYNCAGVLQIINETLHELGININVINLAEQNLPYCSNSFVQGAFSTIEKEISSSDGVIFLTTSNIFAPSAVMQNFLEHLSQPVYKNTLKNKNCMIIAISNIQDVSSTINYLSSVVNYLGGYDSVKIPMNYSMTKTISQEDKILIEKYTEDYYRYVKQGRRFFTPVFSGAKATTQLVQPAGGVFQKPVVANAQIPVPTVEKLPDPMSAREELQSIFASHNVSAPQTNTVNNFYKTQEDDILEITKTLTSKLGKPLDPVEKPTFGVKDIFNNDLTNFNKANISPTILNAKQMTQNLVHYFQPQIADGLICNFGLNIVGVEAFDGALCINGTSCNYVDIYPNPDVIITASDDVWKQIVKGSTTAQRAFMTGQIKVRGNFVLLSKFDTLFKR